MKNRDFWLLMTILIGILLIALCSGCNTAKKAVRQSTNAIANHPKEVLPIFRGAFPCVETSADTTFFINDTTIYVDCPDSVSASQYFTLHDTVIVAGKTIIKEGKTIRVPVTLPQKTITVVKTVEDLSRIAEKDIVIKETQDKADKFENGMDKWRKWFFILLGITLVSWIPYVIKLKKSFSITSLIK